MTLGVKWKLSGMLTAVPLVGAWNTLTHMAHGQRVCRLSVGQETRPWRRGNGIKKVERNIAITVLTLVVYTRARVEKHKLAFTTSIRGYRRYHSQQVEREELPVIPFPLSASFLATMDTHIIGLKMLNGYRFSCGTYYRL
jgi:hypothetical protein